MPDIRYNPQAGRFIGENGKFLSAIQVQQVVTGEQTRLNTQIQAALGRLFEGETSIKDLQVEAAQLLKASHLRITTLGAGGEKSLRSNPEIFRYFGQSGSQLKREYARLVGTGTQIANGELSEAQIRDRFRRQSLRLNETFFRAELLTRASQQGHNEGKRFLGAAVKHCPSCPGYQVAEWTDISEIVPKGTACECGGYCYCTVTTRFNPDRAISLLQQDSLPGL